MFDTLIAFIKGLLATVLGWVVDFVSWAFLSLWKLLLEGLASVIESIPVPSFISGAQSFFGGIPSGIVYFFQFFAVAEGLAMISAALLLRFILRRIPLIG